MADGGNVEFVEIDGLVVKLKLAGACGSCPSSLTTMTMGIKRRLMEKIPVSCSRRQAVLCTAHTQQQWEDCEAWLCMSTLQQQEQPNWTT